MKNSEFRKLLAQSFEQYNAYYGDNIGTFGEYDYKINYQIVSNTLLENVRTYILDIDIYSKSTSMIDDIVDEIEKIFNYQSKKLDNWATFLLDTRFNSDEKDMYRRTLSYTVKTYSKED